MDREPMGDNSKLNTIILGVATFGITTLIGIAMSKIDDVDDKVEGVNTKIEAVKDKQSSVQVDLSQRLTKVEVKMDQLIKENKE